MGLTMLVTSFLRYARGFSSASSGALSGQALVRSLAEAIAGSVRPNSTSDGANKPVEPTGTSRFCQRAFAALRRLVPAAHRYR